MMYGGDYSAMHKGELYSAIREFLKDHNLAELFRIISDVLEYES